MQSFHTPGPLMLDVDLPAGSLEIDAVAGDETTVELDPRGGEAARAAVEAATVELRPRGNGHELVVHVPQRRGLLSLALGREPDVAVRVRCPLGAGLRARTRAADVIARGMLGPVDLKTAAGDARLEDVDGTLDATGASGDLRAGHVRGAATLKTASGDLSLERVDGRLEASLVSGDLDVGDVRAGGVVNSVSGDVTLAAVREGTLEVRAVSGDIRVGIRRGSVVRVDATSVSGSMTSDLALEDRPPGDADGPRIDLRARTVSGDVRIARAAALEGEAAEAPA